MTIASEQPDRIPTRSSTSAAAPLTLRYFEDILPVEFDAIEARRDAANARLGLERPVAIEPLPVGPNDEAWLAEARILPDRGPSEPGKETDRALSPDPARLFPRGERTFGPGEEPHGTGLVDFDRQEPGKMRPRPVPCTVNGLALSGGGIRSAAVALGGLQALNNRQALPAIDYLSTVSGGGYIGASLSAAMSPEGGGEFPFGEDVSDNWALEHLRNYSNYLLPRGRGSIRNGTELAAVTLRGLLANIVIVFAFVAGFALLTKFAYPAWSGLGHGSFLQNLFHLPWRETSNGFWLTLLLSGITALLLVAWALLRALPSLDLLTGDTQGAVLSVAHWLLAVVLVSFLLDLQPLAIEALPGLKGFITRWWTILTPVAAALPAVSSFFGDTLGRFLTTTQRSSDWTKIALRVMTTALLVVSSLILPAVLWLCYLLLATALIKDPLPLSGALAALLRLPGRATILDAVSPTLTCVVAFVVTAAVALFLRPNAYSLHRFYRDRLSKAFIFGAPPRPAPPHSQEPRWLDGLRLSQLSGDAAPYHIINAALNVQGSKEANRRGRGADFFMFTQDFVGSDLTHYAPSRPLRADTATMEQVDRRLDLATAMSISGAAISANMGGNTVRLMSPTLALLNVRLGYWLRNPHDVARRGFGGSAAIRLVGYLKSKLYLLSEMLNLLDETLPYIYLTDGGHIENLGVYELLKRGCQLVIVIDAEADPSLAFGSLIALERYARIDLGIRIALPWEDIAATTLQVKKAAAKRPIVKKGPHCAVGKIFYENRSEGTIVYFKSSVTGDEKDYVLDYMKRNPAFPHENTGDQFFSEEQFEAYRSLGFHMVDRFFSGDDDFAFLTRAHGGFPNPQAATDAVRRCMAMAAVP